ncbi:hypothetical protein JW992_03800 [candidate division KSB1 bacterium]|nr:hypothetical protein [candidate division KSB1 bacterium]
MRQRNPLDNIDKAFWLADDRIAVRLSRQCRGIDQIDYHGAQPVSRNAVLLQNPGGVLRPQLLIESGGEIQIVEVDWQAVRACPAALRTAVVFEGGRAEWRMALNSDKLVISCRVCADDTAVSADRVGLRLVFDRRAMTTAVHGERSWRFRRYSEGFEATARDRIELRSWLRRSGDYQGDFLIPESWRRLIFQHRVKSGLARLEDVFPAYRDSELAFVDAETRILCRGSGWSIDDGEEESIVQFTVWADRSLKNGWRAPDLLLRFSHRQIEPAPAFIGSVFSRQRLRYRKLQEQSPRLVCESLPAIQRFFHRVPSIYSASWIEDVGLFRACQGSYYWVWAWDNMVAGLVLPRWGALETMRRQIDFLRSHREIDGSIPMRWSRKLEPMDAVGFGALDFLFSELVLACAAETGDLSVIRDNYAVVVQAFHSLVKRTRSDSLFTSIGFYPDLPAKLGRSADSVVAIDAGAWYGLCRNTALFAAKLGDMALAEEAEKRAEAVRQAGLDLLWDAEKGFFYDSISGENGQPVRCYGLYSLLVAESRRGIDWLEPVLPDCARFLQDHLLSDDGLLMTPTWDAHHHSETALASWYPHWDWLAVRLWLRAGCFSALHRWLERVEACLQTLDYCPEFVTPDRQVAPFSRHGAVWNLNCTAGWYSALIAALTGVEFADDGIIIHPLEGMPQATLKSVAYRGGRWTLVSRGQSASIGSLIWNGQVWNGGAFIPAKRCTAEDHVLEIER